MNVGGFSTELKSQQTINRVRDDLHTQKIRFFFGIEVLDTLRYPWYEEELEQEQNQGAPVELQPRSRAAGNNWTLIFAESMMPLIVPKIP